MAVYVDEEANRLGRMVMCHMFADTLEELHEMALAIGMRREWFQVEASFPHYDVAKGRRARAVELGAVEVDRYEGRDIRRRLRADATFIAAWREARSGVK